MEDNNLLENIDFSENFLTQDQIKCELLEQVRFSAVLRLQKWSMREELIQLMAFLYLYFTKPVEEMQWEKMQLQKKQENWQKYVVGKIGKNVLITDFVQWE